MTIPITLNFLSDVVLGIAFLIVFLTFFAAINRQERLNQRFKWASFSYAVGMLAVALSILSPHTWPSINGTTTEFLIKLATGSIIVIASFLAWPLIKLSRRDSRLIASLSDTELLLLERDDFAAAKSKLEEEIVRRSYQLERVSRQMRLAISGSKITIFRQDKDLRYTWIFNVPPQTSEADYIGKTDYDIFPPDVALTIVEVKNSAIEAEEERSAEVRVRFPHGVFWYFLQTQPDYDTDGKIIGTISCAVDITEQKRQQQRQLLLMREVTHRSKNLLAVLQGIVRQTALRTKNLDEFQVRLTARLQSLARSHDLLVNDDWSGTAFRKLLQSELSILSDFASSRITFQGPDLLLTAVAVQNLGLAFHELSTNALKYGALSCPEGRVDIGWEIVEAGSPFSGTPLSSDHLQIIWAETGGPNVEKNDDKGFGRTLLERVVGQALNGSVKLDFLPGGIVCTMILPASRTIENEDSETSITTHAKMEKFYANSNV